MKLQDCNENQLHIYILKVIAKNMSNFQKKCLQTLKSIIYWTNNINKHWWIEIQNNFDNLILKTVLFLPYFKNEQFYTNTYFLRNNIRKTKKKLFLVLNA